MVQSFISLVIVIVLIMTMIIFQMIVLKKITMIIMIIIIIFRCEVSGEGPLFNTASQEWVFVKIKNDQGSVQLSIFKIKNAPKDH